MSNLSLVSDSYYKHVSSTNKLILHTVFALFLLTLIFDCLVVFSCIPIKILLPIDDVLALDVDLVNKHNKNVGFI